MKANSNLDRIDRLILRELQRDAKLTNATLADRASLSESACLRRVRRLEESGLIRAYVTLLDQSLAGFPEDIFVQITLKSQQRRDLEAFERAVVTVPEVMECYLMSGSADYIVRLIASDARDYERIHSQYLTCLPGVDRVQSSFALRTVVKRTEISLR